MSKSRAVRRAVAAAGHRDPDALIDALDDLDTSGIDDPAASPCPGCAASRRPPRWS